MRRMDSDGDGKIMRVCKRDREIDGYIYKYVHLYIERGPVSLCVLHPPPTEHGRGVSIASLMLCITTLRYIILEGIKNNTNFSVEQYVLFTVFLMYILQFCVLYSTTVMLFECLIRIVTLVCALISSQSIPSHTICFHLISRHRQVDSAGVQSSSKETTLER